MEEVVFDTVKIKTSEKGHLLVYIKNFNTPVYVSGKNVAKIECETVMFSHFREKEKLKRFLSVNYNKECDLVMGFCF